MRHRFLLAATSKALALLLFLTPGAARADFLSVETNFNSVSPGLSGFLYSFNGNNSLSTTAGVFNFTTIVGGNTNLGTFQTICIDLSQFTNNPTLYTLKPLEDGPVPGTGTGGLNVNGPMGTTKANELREFWAENFSSIGNDNIKAAAFQIGAWAIVYDNDNDLNVSDTADNFYARTQTDSNLTNAVTMAQNWLNALNDSDVTEQFENRLVALTSDTFQDQIALGPIPEPSTLILCGIGGATLGVFASFRRRRRLIA
jgi:hypothetical protein